MTVEQAEDFSTLHERVLTFIGAFSSTQSTIDVIVGMYLRRQMKVLGEELNKQFLRRVRDEQRAPIFKAFTEQIDYTVDAVQFSGRYNRAKQLRDMIRHSVSVLGPVYGMGIPVVGVSGWTTNNRLVPRPSLPSTFDRMKVDCEWMTQHVNRVGYEGNAATFVNGGMEPYEPPVPPSEPEGGEPLR